MHYLALMFGREDGPVAEPGTPEFDAELERYAAFEAAAGAAIAGGVALHPSSTTVHVRQGVVTDGPFVEQAEVVGGFTVFENENLDDCLRLVADLPAAARAFLRRRLDEVLAAAD